MGINSMLKKMDGELRNKLIMYSSSFLFGVLGALLVCIFANYFHSPALSIGTVNITNLVDSFIKEESAKNLSPDLLKKEVSTFGKHLEKELNALSAHNHLVLLPTEAVVAGSHDYTSLIRQRLSPKQSGDV
jgi:hypothetical protein